MSFNGSDGSSGSTFNNAETDSRKIVFAFGPKSTYFLEYNGLRKWNNLPHRMLEILEKAGDEAVEQTFFVAFTPTAFTPNTGWIMIYKNYIGDIKKASYSLPSPLEEWINGSPLVFKSGEVFPLDVQTIEVSFTAIGGFFATALDNHGDRQYRWYNLRPHESTCVQRYLTSSPQGNKRNHWQVTFGYYGDRVVVYQSSPDSANTWYQSVQNPVLEELLRDQDDLRGSKIVLNPYISGQWFFLRPDGSAEWNINQAFSLDITEVTKKILEDRSLHGSTPAA